MSKSHGNIVSPDEYVETYGSDAFRMYLMFGFSYTEGGPWNDDGIKAIAKFLDRVEKLVRKVNKYKTGKDAAYGADEKALDYAKNYAIDRVSKDLEAFSFNTAIARIMELVNALGKYDALETKNIAVEKAAVRDLVLLLAPFAPHFCEELWEEIDGRGFVFEQRYPVANESALHLDEKEYAVQVNSKMACRAMISTTATEEEVKALVLALPEVQEKMAGKTVKKCIIVPGRLVNLIVG